MKYTSKDLPRSVREVEVVFDHNEFLNYWQSVYDLAASGAEIKGFRPGTAPKELIDKAIDKEKVFNEAVSKAAHFALKEIAREKSWEFIDQPKIEVLENPTGLKFKAILVVFPRIKLGDYKKIAKVVMAESKKKEIKVEDFEADKAIDWVLKSRARITRVNRPAQKGDVVDIQYEGKHDHFVLGEGKFKEGFEDKIIGHKENEKFDGIELQAVFERKIPELNDDFVKGLGHFKTAEEFKKSVKEGILKEKEDREIERLRLKLLEGISKETEIDMPQILVDKTLENMMADYKHYLKHGLEKGEIKEEDLRKDMQPKAENQVIYGLIIHQISKEEDLEPTAEEIENEANNLLREWGIAKPSQIDSQKIYDYSYDIIRRRKVFEFLERL